jgi:hypothetical protein
MQARRSPRSRRSAPSTVSAADVPVPSADHERRPVPTVVPATLPAPGLLVIRMVYEPRPRGPPRPDRVAQSRATQPRRPRDTTTGDLRRSIGNGRPGA